MIKLPDLFKLLTKNKKMAQPMAVLLLMWMASIWSGLRGITCGHCT